MVDVISQYTKLKKVGSQYVGLCPFHNEKTPSFYVNEKKGYKCFGCEKSGVNAIDFLMAIEKIDFPGACRRLAGMTGIVLNDSKPFVPNRKPIQRPESIKVDYIPKEKLAANLAAYRRNNLYQFFVGLFGGNTATDVFNKYHVGSFKDGATMFVQTDINGNYRQVKKIVYKEDGHRNKAVNPLIIGRQLTKSDNLKQCFFGEHLLKDNDKPIAVVESEKTALICSITYPKYSWLATGGKTGCNIVNPDVNKVLRGRRIYLFPDVDGVADWQKYEADLREQGFDINLIDISEGFESMQGTKFDIADLVVSKLKNEQDVPGWYVDSMGILQSYESGEITGNEYLDRLQKNFENSGLGSDDYVRQVNGGLAWELEAKRVKKQYQEGGLTFSNYESLQAVICSKYEIKPNVFVEFVNSINF